MNKLPDLPKQNRMSESSSSLKFRKWWQLKGKNAPYEMKDTRGTDSFRFDELSEEQELFGKACGTDKGVLIRIEHGTPGAPDYVGFKNTVSYVVIKFRSGFEVITIDNFLHARDTCGRKSLTANMARHISSITIKI